MSQVGNAEQVCVAIKHNQACPDQAPTRQMCVLVGKSVRLLALAAVWHAQLCAAAVDVPEQVPAEIVVVGDVHGALQPLKDILHVSGLTDEQDRWAGGASHLVSLGDLIDRGPQSRAVLDFMMGLQTQAQAAGGQVHVLMGNHELMNLTGDLRDVSEPEMESYGGQTGHTQLFAADGKYGSWLMQFPSILNIDGNLFVHGGLSSVFRDLSVDEANRRIRNSITTLLTHQRAAAEYWLSAQSAAEQSGPLQSSPAPPSPAQPSKDLLQLTYEIEDLLTGAQTRTPPSAEVLKFIDAGKEPLLGSLGPHWYRGSAACHGLIETPKVQQILQHLGGKRLVIGHTPTPDRRVRARLGAKVIAVDTGMLAAVYRGEPYALHITGNQLWVNSIQGEKLAVQPEVPNRAARASLEQALREVEVESVLGNEVRLVNGLRAHFVRLNPRQVKRELAAYRLDRMLGLEMVPVTVRREISGVQGVLQFVAAGDRERWLSEQLRQEGGYRRPNHCETGNDYDLLSAFDSLIAKRDRNLTNLQYHIPSWDIRITEQSNAFATDNNLNSYTHTPKLSGLLAERLNMLSEEDLAPLLSDLLSSRQIKAILKRRDRLLTWPVE